MHFNSVWAVCIFMHINSCFFGTFVCFVCLFCGCFVSVFVCFVCCCCCCCFVVVSVFVLLLLFLLFSVCFQHLCRRRASCSTWLKRAGQVTRQQGASVSHKPVLSLQSVKGCVWMWVCECECVWGGGEGGMRQTDRQTEERDRQRQEQRHTVICTWYKVNKTAGLSVRCFDW